MPVCLLTSFPHLRGLEHGVDDHVDILVLPDLRSQVLGEDDGDVDDNDDADSPIHLGVDEEEEVGHAQQGEQDQGCSHCSTDLERDVGLYRNITSKSSFMEKKGPNDDPKQGCLDILFSRKNFVFCSPSKELFSFLLHKARQRKPSAR